MLEKLKPSEGPSFGVRESVREEEVKSIKELIGLNEEGVAACSAVPRKWDTLRLPYIKA
jgi:hypothetical protein